MAPIWTKRTKTEVVGTFALELAELSRADSSKDSFKIKHVPINISELSQLSEAIRSNKTLKEISLIDARLNNAAHLVEFFESVKSSQIEKIDLSENSIGDEGAQLLADAIQMKTCVRTVGLRDCDITLKGCDSLKMLLELNKKIENLDVADNEKIGDEGIRLISQGILDSPLGERSSIRELNLTGCRFGDEACKILGSVIASCPQISALNLSKNEIRRNGVKFISHALMKRHQIAGPADEGLENLDLSGNRIKDEGVISVAKKLGKSKIRSLNLNSVGMGVEGLKKLCEQLRRNDYIEELDIGSNPLDGDVIPNVLLTFLENSSSLITLDLKNIKLSMEDINSLGEFLGRHVSCRLKHLSLSNTGITDEMCMPLCGGLMNNTELQTLDVTGNPFGAKGARIFSRMFKRAKTLNTFKVTGQSRIKAEGENYLAECLKFHKKLEIVGVSTELNYLSDFVKRGKAFTYTDGVITGWSEEAWETVKRGCGQVLATVIYQLNKKKTKEVRAMVSESRNVVNQTMFEHLIRHAEAPALDPVNMFVNKLGMALDTCCDSKASVAMSKDYRKADDVTFRSIAKDHAKDPMVKAMAKNNRLFMGRYLTKNGPAIHETADVIRVLAKDTLAQGKDKDKSIYVQIYESDEDFRREVNAREQLKSDLAAGGPFAIYDTILKDVEVHQDQNCASFMSCVTDLRHSINNLGVTAGFNLKETVFLAKSAAQCLGTLNNLGRIHGDFRPRNLVMVAKKRLGNDPLGRSSKKVMLPDKWVLMDLSKSVPHGTLLQLRKDSAYLPPEVATVEFHNKYGEKQLPEATEKTDVWAFGVVLYQLLSGAHLFHVEQNTDRIYRDQERLELANWINLDAKRQALVLHKAGESFFANETTYNKIKTAAVDLLNWCLQGDPYNRPSFNDILSHPFFKYKAHVNYTDVDLLLGWYDRIGSSIKAATHKNNRTHVHVANSSSKEMSGIYESIDLLYIETGCMATNDRSDWKIDISKRKDKVQKARAFAVLLEEDVFWRPEIVKKLLWAQDSLETHTLLLIDTSSACTNSSSFSFEAFKDEVESDSKESKKKLNDLVDQLYPIKQKLDLKNLDFKDSKKWLKKYIKTELLEFIMNQKARVLPYRPRRFQAKAMVDEMLTRSDFMGAVNLKPFNLCEMMDDDAEDKQKPTEKSTVKVLVLYNEETANVSNDVQKLRRQVLTLHSGAYEPEVTLISQPRDVVRHFKVETGSRSWEATAQTLVLAIVSEGFYDEFRDVIQDLNNARGVVSVLPIAYANFDPSNPVAKEEVLNLGLENSAVVTKLLDQRSYLPLPEAKSGLEYESNAALGHILKEATKAIDVTKSNEKKDESDVYTRYTRTNFFEAVY